MRTAAKTFTGRWLRLTMTAAIGCLGLAWGVSALPTSEATDDYRDLETHLLRFETFSPAALTQTLQGPAPDSLDACDTHSQRAMLLMELPLAQAALRSGAVLEFDRHVQSLEARSKRILSCAPRESFVWLLLFDLEVLHGQLNPRSFDLLAMSYDTSPNEAWIAIRRTFVAVPRLLSAPEPVRQKILFEFQQLIRHGFTAEAARSYTTAPAPIRSLLQAQVDQLDNSGQKAFAEALQRLHS